MCDKDEDLENVRAELSSFATDSDTNSRCDECCLPLADYGYNPILIAGENDNSIFRELCDLHTAEFFGEDVSDNPSECVNIIIVKRNEHTEKSHIFLGQFSNYKFF